jgi:hypothetical protein
MSLDTLTASAAYPVTLAGKTYEVRKLKLREWGELQSWLKTSVPSPVVEAVRALQALKAGGDKVDPDVRESILSHAQEAARLWPPRVGSMPWIVALDETPGGAARLIAAAIRATGTVIGADEADEMGEACTSIELGDLIRVCLYGEMPSPKLMASAMTTDPPRNWLTAAGGPSSPTTGTSGSGESTTEPGGLPDRSEN